MILDSSAILAVLLEEPAGDLILQQLQGARIVAVGAPTLVETAMVLSSRFHRDAKPILDGFLRHSRVEVIPFGEEHYEVALDAFWRYGKGRHPAGLNFGDCLAYAVARLTGLPLLYVGDDFSKTDVAQ